MTSRASFFAVLFPVLIVAASAACTSITGSSDCGPSACGACESGSVNDDRCEGGEWSCRCVPSSDPAAKANATTPSDDAGSEASMPSPLPVFTCQEKLASPTKDARCVADDWDKSCEQGCLSCRCDFGRWACTTSASCFDAGSD